MLCYDRRSVHYPLHNDRVLYITPYIMTDVLYIIPYIMMGILYIIPYITTDVLYIIPYITTGVLYITPYITTGVLYIIPYITTGGMGDAPSLRNHADRRALHPDHRGNLVCSPASLRPEDSVVFASCLTRCPVVDVVLISKRLNPS